MTDEDIVEPIALPFRPFGHTTRIQNMVALSYGIRPDYMKSPHRVREVAWPRQVAMFLTREITHRSLFAIGQSFGGRDHTTVIHAIRSVQDRMKADPSLRADVAALREALAA